MYILGLDISSNTGWALFENENLICCGLLANPTKTYEFPWGFYSWSKNTASAIADLVFKYAHVDKIVIERTNLGRNREFQTYLEWIHGFFLLNIDKINLNEKICYVDTSQWRKKINLKLSTDQRKQNKFINVQHKNGVQNVLQNGKRIGKVTSKHLSVNYVNDNYSMNFKLKHNDIADAICIALSQIK